MINQGSNTSTADGQASTGAALENSGTAGVNGALTGLGAYNAADTNNASTVGSNAQSLVNAQNIPAQVQADMNQATQQANEVTMPGIEQNAAAGGNTNSSRTGIADGLVQQGLAEQSASLQGSLTGQAEANAENLAQTQANNNNVNNLGALSSEGSVGNTAANTGVNAGTAATNDQIADAGEAAAGGAGQTAAEQAALTNQEQQFQSATTSPYAALQGLMGIAGTNNWGTDTTGTSDTTATPSAWSTISGLLSSGGSLLNGISTPKAPAVMSAPGDLGAGTGGLSFPMFE
jgi:hypothetical protein